MNLAFNTRRDAFAVNLVGPGIYAIGFDDTLIYIGLYRGMKTAPFSGNVSVARWEKHLGTLTLRSRYLSMRRSTLTSLQSRAEIHPPFRDIAGLVDPEVLLHNRGCETTVHRALFASSHWDEFRKLSEATLRRFKFHYVRVDPRAAMSFDKVAACLPEVERGMVHALRPVCNKAVAEGTSRRERFDDACTSIAAAFGVGLQQQFRLEPQALYFRAQPRPSASDSETAADLRAVDCSVAQVSLLGGGVRHDDGETTEAFDAPQGDDESDGDGEAEPADLVAEFLDRFASHEEATALVHDVRMVLDLADVDIHFTRAHGGDMRIACQRPNGGSYIIATVWWQPRLAQFRAQLHATASACEVNGATVASHKPVTKLLETEATFQVPATGNALLRCILASINRFEDAHGRERGG